MTADDRFKHYGRNICYAAMMLGWQTWEVTQAPRPYYQIDRVVNGIGISYRFALAPSGRIEVRKWPTSYPGPTFHYAEYFAELSRARHVQ